MFEPVSDVCNDDFATFMFNNQLQIFKSNCRPPLEVSYGPESPTYTTTNSYGQLPSVVQGHGVGIKPVSIIEMAKLKSMVVSIMKL